MDLFQLISYGQRKASSDERRRRRPPRTDKRRRRESSSLALLLLSLDSPEEVPHALLKAGSQLGQALGGLANHLENLNNYCRIEKSKEIVNMLESWEMKLFANGF